MVERKKSLIREIKGILVLPIYCIESTYRLGSLKVYWVGSHNFHIPEFLLDTVWCWVHEFSEVAILDLLPLLLQRKGINISLLGVAKFAWMPHLMVCLHLPSIMMIDGEHITIQPQVFSESMPWRRRHD